MTIPSISPLRSSVSGYRCFIEPLSIQISKTTVITGANNSGKSNVLRAIAVLMNAGKEGKALQNSDFSSPSRTALFQIDVPVIHPALKPLKLASAEFNAALQSRNIQSLPLALRIGMSGRTIDKAITKQLWSGLGISNKDISIAAQQFCGRSSSDSEENAGYLALAILPGLSLDRGTTYLPSSRYILRPNTSPVNYTQSLVAGRVLSTETIVDLLHSLDRPTENDQHLKSRLRNIEDFIAYALNRRKVTIEVSSDRSQILCSIDGTMRSLTNLGTGIEQLVMVGCAALGTDGELILLEEPELHLHPTTQRRMIEYIARSPVTLVVTTHSACMLDAAPAALLHLRNDGNASVGDLLLSDADRFEAVMQLGYRASDLAQANFIVWVEGPSDRIYIKKWLHLQSPNLVENIDYIICFYGGRLLSHLSIDEDVMVEEFISVLAINRNCAVVIDSDKSSSSDVINHTKKRIEAECLDSNVSCWVTLGREIENYIPGEVLAVASEKMTAVRSEWSQYDRCYDSDKVDKLKLARFASEHITEVPDTLDLRGSIVALAEAIESVRDGGT